MLLKTGGRRRTDSPSLRTMRRNLLSVPTLITPARSCLKNGQDMRLTWLRIRREFASDWLSFQNESTGCLLPAVVLRKRVESVDSLRKWSLEWLSVTTCTKKKPPRCLEGFVNG